MKNLTALISLIILPFISFSQEWTKEFPKEVNLIKMTDAGIAIVGTNDALYGLDENGKELWSNEKLKKVEPASVEILSGSELVFIKDKGLLGTNQVLNVHTGQAYTEGVGIAAARINHNNNQLWTTSNFRSMDVWDISSNTLMYSITQEYLRNKTLSTTSSSFQGLQPFAYVGKNDAILHLSLGHLGRYNLLTGKSVWEFDWKPFKIKADKGFVASEPSRGYSTMKLDNETNTIFFPFMQKLISINLENGQCNWDPKKGGKTGKVKSMFLTKDGILILTPKGVQLVDKSTGEFKWDKAIKIKGATAAILVKGENHFFTVSKGAIIKIDVANRSTKTLTEKIKFKGGETFSGLEIKEKIIIMSSDQNVAAIDKSSGKIMHQTYLKAPGQGALAIAQNIALAAVATAATANSANINRNGGNTTGNRYTYHSYTPRVMESGGPATTSTGNTMYISTKFKDADASGFGMAKVDKATGKIQDKIIIGDRDPVYDINHKDALIYYKASKKSVSMKKIN